MKKLKRVGLILVLVGGSNCFWSLKGQIYNLEASQADVNIQRLSQQIGENFSKIGLKGLSKISGVKNSTLWNRITSATLSYSTRKVEILLRGGVEVNVAELLMEKSAVWYSQLLVKIFNGEDALQAADEYINKVRMLFTQVRLNSSSQSEIVTLIRNHFNEMGVLLTQLKGLVGESNPQPSPSPVGESNPQPSP